MANLTSNQIIKRDKDVFEWLKSDNNPGLFNTKKFELAPWYSNKMFYLIVDSGFSYQGTNYSNGDRFLTSWEDLQKFSLDLVLDIIK